MEGVGARLGRSSTRFQPAAVFTGPVRKWTKRWVPLPNPTNPKTTTTTTSNNNNESHLLLFKWTPISSTQTNGSTAAAPAVTHYDPPKRKFRYVPVSVVEAQKQNADENSGSETGSSPQATQEDDSNIKSEPDDVLMEDAQAANKGTEAAEEGIETNLDLNLN